MYHWYKWMAIVFLFHSEMNGDTKENEECQTAALIWCIVQATEILLGPLFVCCLW